MCVACILLDGLNISREMYDAFQRLTLAAILVDRGIITLESLGPIIAEAKVTACPAAVFAARFEQLLRDRHMHVPPMHQSVHAFAAAAAVPMPTAAPKTASPANAFVSQQATSNWYHNLLKPSRN